MTGRVSRVIDGDTLEIDSDDGYTDRIRLVLVDAPGSYEAGGREATAYLTGLCLDQRALFDEDDFQVGADPYGRVLAVVYCDGANANGAMIASGQATKYTRFCPASEFERVARTDGHRGASP